MRGLVSCGEYYTLTGVASEYAAQSINGLLTEIYIEDCWKASLFPTLHGVFNPMSKKAHAE